MSSAIQERQFIIDKEGKTIGVILSVEEFALVKDVLDHQSEANEEAEKLSRMEHAPQDPLFIADLEETMSAFADADSEWWEPNQ